MWPNFGKLSCVVCSGVVCVCCGVCVRCRGAVAVWCVHSKRSARTPKHARARRRNTRGSLERTHGHVLRGAVQQGEQAASRPPFCVRPAELHQNANTSLPTAHRHTTLTRDTKSMHYSLICLNTQMFTSSLRAKWPAQQINF